MRGPVPPGKQAAVGFVLPDGSEGWLRPGEFMGRSHRATVRLDDPRVSEAHAMVSLRGGQLKLLALRGMLALDRQPLTEVVLEPGLEIHLARGVSVGVSSVQAPEKVLALEGQDLARELLLGQSASLVLHPTPSVVPGYVDHAAAYLWSDGATYHLRIADGPVLALDPDTQWELQGRTFRIVAIDLEGADAPSTRLQGRLHPPLTVIVSFDTAAIHRPNHPPMGLGGMSARLLTELVAVSGPAHWAVLAREIWPELTDDLPLRRRWDRNLARLRLKLKEAGIRPDLIRSDGSGQCELFLYEGDQIDDRS